MRLSRLEQAVRNEAAKHQWPSKRCVARTLHVVLTPALADIEGQVTSRFREQGDDLCCFRPWLVWPDEGAGETRGTDALRALLAAAFEAEKTARIRYDGVMFLDHATQVIMLWDEGDPDASGRLDRLHDTLDDWLVGSPAAPTLYRIGIALSVEGRGKPTASSPTAPSAARTGHPRSKTTSTGLNSHQRLHRLFNLDPRNSRGEVAGAEDLRFLAAQLTVLLGSYPFLLPPGEGEPFRHWISVDSAGEGFVTGFSGAAAAYPVERMANWALVSLAGQALARVVTLQPDDARVEALLTSFLNRLHLHTREALISELLRRVPPLPDPLGTAWEGALGNRTWTPDTGDEYAAFGSVVDSSLPSLAELHGQVLRKLVEVFADEFGLALDDQLDSIMAREPEGVTVAARFLERLADHLANLVPAASDVPPLVPDPLPVLSRLRQETAAGPRRASVVARTLMLMLGMGCAWYALGADVHYPEAVFGGMVPFSGFAGWFYWHSYRTRMERLASMAQNLIAEKWNLLLAWRQNEALGLGLFPLQDLVASRKNQVAAADRRLHFLAGYFATRYTPGKTQHPFEVDLCKDVSNPQRFSRLVKVELTAFVKDYFLRNRPLQLWKRLEDPGRGTEQPLPNDWEWNLAEGLSLELVAKAEGIFLQTAADQFVLCDPEGAPQQAADGTPRLDETMLERTVAFLKRAAHPFIQWNPNQTSPDLHGTLVLPAGCIEGVRNALSGLSGEGFHRFEELVGGSRYELQLSALTSGLKESDHSVARGTPPERRS